MDLERRVQRTIDILQDAQARARELAQRPPGDPVMGTWYLRADQKNVYETACELALEVLRGKEKAATAAPGRQ